MLNLPELSMMQYQVVSNMMSFAIAAMFAGALFFFFSRQFVAPKYRLSMLITALVPAIAFYHYLRIYISWDEAYMLQQGVGTYVASGVPFNDAYRYVDWLLTVPLLTTELILTLGLAAAATRKLAWKLALAAAIMIVLGYPGEIATETGPRMLWWTLSMVPFIYILYVLFTEFSRHIKDQPKEAQGLYSSARGVLLVTWLFYPIAYLFPMVGLSGAAGEVALQVGYTIADVTAKVGFGVLIFFICRAKTRAEGWQPFDALERPNAAGVAGSAPAPAGK